MKTVFVLVILAIAAGTQVKAPEVQYSPRIREVIPNSSIHWESVPPTPTYVVALNCTVEGGMKMFDYAGATIVEVKPDGRIVGDAARALRMLATAMTEQQKATKRMVDKLQDSQK